ncbi:hypothetical protein Ddye_027418 [Dipteronia dyeriana]|uniref:Aminotransferase-like plant mobile domain-containing protein n=1 Tax=Dipteronia dyeriana TaxID=168575 RepID=A0AAD9TPV7_9ROSI|nr:hypothetical protein Ddye_027418 [Dipteronia dyeriana]
MLRVENVRTVLDSAKESFDWRPYAKTLKNWNFPKFYAEKEMWVSVDPDHCEEVESFARCLRISELVGRGCVEHYFPHRVAMQFGLDQDLPACVAQVNDYSKPISDANLYVPPRLYEADVTTRYLDWWNESVLHLQAAKGGVLLRKRTFRSSRITWKNRSKRAKRVNHVKDGFSFSSSMMKTKKSLVTSTEEKEDDSDASNSAGLPSKTLPLNESPFPPGFLPKTNLVDARVSTNKRHDDVGNEQLNDSPFPPGVRHKFNLVHARDTTKEDNLTTTGLSMSSRRCDDVGNGRLGDGEHSSDHCQKKLFNEADKIVVPLTELIEKQNELVKRSLETAMEDAAGSKTGSSNHDMEENQDVEGDGNEHEVEIQELQLEDRVSRLERIFAELKAARFGHNSKSFR